MYMAIYICTDPVYNKSSKVGITWTLICLLEPFWLMELPVDWEGQICVGCCFLKTKTCRSLMKRNKRTGISGISGIVSHISFDKQKWSKGFELVFQSANKLLIVQSYVSIPQSLDLNWWIPRLVFMATLKIIFVNCDFATIQPECFIFHWSTFK